MVLNPCRALWNAHSNMYEKLLKRYLDLQSKYDILKSNYNSLNKDYEKLQHDFNAFENSNPKKTMVKVADSMDFKIEYPKSFISVFKEYGHEKTKCEVTDIKISRKNSQVIVSFIAKKISDKNGETSNTEIRFNYKVKDSSGVVVSKGYWVEYNIYVGDTVRGSMTIEDMPTSGCVLEFFDFVR